MWYLWAEHKRNANGCEAAQPSGIRRLPGSIILHLMHDAPQAPKPAPFSPKNFPWRLRIIALLIVAGFLAVLVRLFYIQILRGADLREKARKQYEAKIELRAERGKILDRNGTIIAETIQSASFAADPKMLEHSDDVIALLARCSGIEAGVLKAKVEAARSRNFVWLARGLNVNAVSMLDSITDPGFIRLSEPRRNYVHGSMAAQLIGCTDVDNRGLAGIELALDSLLRGQSGIAVMQRDGRGRMRPGVNNIVQPAQHGHNVQLTLDAELQQIVEYELRTGIEKSRAVSGTAIALNPATGEVIALASYPVYDPNVMGVQRSADAMRLRAITDMYEPGSTFKLVTSAIALEQKSISPETMVDGLNGEMRFSDGSVITDHEPMSTVTLTEALEKSSNIVFAKLAHAQQNATLYRYTRNFGFGIPTGFDIPGEVRGLLKKPNEFDRSTKLFMGFGYQLAATALQMANCYAAIANNGVLMRPYIVKSITDANGKTLLETQPQSVRRVVSAATAQTLRSMFTSVVERGTGMEAKVRGLTIAGKTGTAQNIRSQFLKNLVNSEHPMVCVRSMPSFLSDKKYRIV
ncbi:MAG: penicillin-binding protein 2, partial [Candidatus Kapabacteria bacterium]|nr:penicillin-binding protein 2 [Candidatus Kapabacteria bacterium]